MYHLVFQGLDVGDIREHEGYIEMLIGIDYAVFHPQIIKTSSNLVLYENRLGKCIGGSCNGVSDESDGIVSQVCYSNLC